MKKIIKSKKSSLSMKKLGIDTYKESVIYLRRDCHICSSEGFGTHSRVRVSFGEKTIIATVNTISSNLLEHGQASLSEYAWRLLDIHEDDVITVNHTKHIKSLSYVRSKIYGNILSNVQIQEIVRDISDGRYSDIHLSSFLTACAGDRMNDNELISLTKAMVEAGEKLTWDSKLIVDKHCIGGLPGNRTTPIIVAIVAAFGLTMPKTSSRAITSPAGTADTMEVLAPVNIDIATIKNVIKKENGCIAWGGASSLSPADDIMISVERALSLDSEAQLIASILSKKIAAGSTHIVIDIPIGPTAKIRSKKMGLKIKSYFETIGEGLGLTIKVVFGDGTQPIGRGIGPALEARDIISVLQNNSHTLQDLRDRAIILAGEILEFSPDVEIGEGTNIATELLDNGKAWQKFQAICEAQGGMREIPKATYTHSYITTKKGRIVAIDNRRIAIIAKLAGAPEDKAAGIDLHVSIGSNVNVNDALFTIHAQFQGKLEYALDYLKEESIVIELEE